MEARLESLKTIIKDFMEIEAPAVAEDIHKKLENKSQVLLDGVNNALDSGEDAVQQLKKSDVYKTINNITDLMNQIKELGL